MTRGMTGKKLLKLISLGLLFIVIIGYGIWRGRDLIFGIKLSVTGVTNNETVKESVLNLSGSAYHAIAITVDGRTVSIEEDGSWQDPIALVPGYNIITVSAKDKFDRIISQTFTVNYDPQPQTIIPETPTPDIPTTATSSTSTITTATTSSRKSVIIKNN